MIDAALGTLIFVFFIVWVTAELAILGTKIKGWLARFSQPQSTHVDQTINQMYGDVNVTSPYAATRNARQAIQPPTKGGRRAGT